MQVGDDGQLGAGLEIHGLTGWAEPDPPQPAVPAAPEARPAAPQPEPAQPATPGDLVTVSATLAVASGLEEQGRG